MIISIISITLALLAADAVPSLVVTSPPQPYCPGPVDFTCTATGISAVFYWKLNNIMISEYTFNKTDQYPLDLTVTSPQIDSIQVTSATLNGNSLNITSTLTIFSSNLSVLTLQCKDVLGRESNTLNVGTTVLQAPPSPSNTILCSSVNQNLTLQWSPEFNNKHYVERYSVAVNPEAPNCSSEHIPSNTDFTCSGLDLATNFMVTVSAINCGNQLGENNSFSVSLQNLVPNAPHNEVISLSNGMLKLRWQESSAVSRNCFFSGAINYTVSLEGNNGLIIVEKNVSSDYCKNGSCSITFNISTLICLINIIAWNEHGQSNISSSVVGIGRLSPITIALLVLGPLVLCVAEAIAIIVYIYHFNLITCSKKIAGCVLLLYFIVPVALWISVGLYEGLQKSSCDSSLNFGLIVTAFIFSIIAITIPVIVAFLKSSKQRLPKGDLQSDPSTSTEKIEIVTYSKKELDQLHVQSAVIRTEGIAEKEAEHFCAVKVQECSVEVHRDDPTQPPNLDSKVGVWNKIEQIYSRLFHTDNQQDNENNMSYDTLENEDGGGVGIRDEGIYSKLGKFPCISLWKYNKFLHHSKKKFASKDNVAFWLAPVTRWPKEDLGKGYTLTFCLVNDCPDKWQYQGRLIDAELIMEFLSTTWSNCFSAGPLENAPIRIYFQDEIYGNWSMIGSLAKKVKRDVPTMMLNFAFMSDDEIRANIVHQFGHALGLGHALMSPDEWDLLREYFNVDVMVEAYGSLNVADFEVQWTGRSLDMRSLNYDEESIMQYSASSSWLKDSASTIILSEVKAKMEKFRQHETQQKHTLSSCDKKTLKHLLEGYLPMSKQDLCKLNLAASLEPIVKCLGLSDTSLKIIEETSADNEERLDLVWNKWLNENEDVTAIKEYPPTWEGLRKLLEKIGKRVLLRTLAS